MSNQSQVIEKITGGSAVLYGTSSYASTASVAINISSTSITASLKGTASVAISASYSLSASYATSASFAPAPDYTSSLFGTASWSTWASNALYVTGSTSVIRNLDVTRIMLFTDVSSRIRIGTSEGDAGKDTPISALETIQIGAAAGYNTTNANGVVQIGKQAGMGSATATNAVQIGYLAGNNATTATQAVQIGYQAGYGGISGALTEAVQIGSNAGVNARFASYSTFIGAETDALNTGLTVTKSIAIGYNAKVSGSSMCVIGGTGVDAVKVGIGTNSPTNTLEVVGNISATSITGSLQGTATSASFAPAPNYTSSLFGTASWAKNASQAVTSYAVYGPGGNASLDETNGLLIGGGLLQLPLDGTAQFADGTTNINAGGQIITTGITASLQGTASYAGTSSQVELPNGNYLRATGLRLGAGAVSLVSDGSATFSDGNITFDPNGFVNVGSVLTVTASNAISASYATSASAATSITFTPASASYATTASNAISASYVLPNTSYQTITTGSVNWITMSLSTENQFFNLTVGQLLNFTASNLPAADNLSECTLFLKNTATATSSLSFPSTWISLAGGWPTSITSSKSAMVWIRAYGTSSIVGTFSSEI